MEGKGASKGRLRGALEPDAETRDRYAEILDATPDFVGTADAEGRTLSVNLAGRRMLGIVEDEDLSGRPIADYHPQWAQEMIFKEGIPAALRNGTWEGETALLSREGREILVSLVIVAHKGGDGEVGYLSTIGRDISERKLAEEALRESNRQIETVLESITDAFVALDREWRYTYVNDRALRHIQRAKGEELSREEVLGKNIWELFPEAVGSVFYQKYHEALSEQKTVEFETYFAPYDRWFEVHAYPSEGGLSIYWRVITERKKTEEEREGLQEGLREHAKRLASVIATQQEIAVAQPDLAAVMDLVAGRMQRLTSADGAAVELAEGEEMVYRATSGTTAPHVGLRLKIEASLSGRCVRSGEILRCDDTEDDPRVDREACRRIGARSMIVVPLRHAGRIVGVLKVVSARVRTFDDGDVDTLRLMAGLIAAAMSHTREFEAKQALLEQRTAALARIQESETRFRAIFEGAGIGVTVVDLGGSIVQSNLALQRFLGFSEAELRSKSITEITHPEDIDADMELFEELVAGERHAYQMEKRYIHKDGHLVWGRLSVSLVRGSDNNPQVVIGMVEDITERKTAEEDLETHARQQRAVADLGRRALTANLATLMDEAVSVVAETLGVEYCKVLELLPEENALLLRAGVGWQEGLVGRAAVSASRQSQAGYTLLSDTPVVVEDLRTEERFSGPPLLREHGVVSGMSAVIRGRERPFGVLGAHTGERRSFTEDDISFLRAVANVLAAAIERGRAEERLHEVKESERNRIARELHDMVLQDLVYVVQELEIARVLPKEAASLSPEGTVEALRRSVRGLREAIHDLHPTDARGLRFAEAVEETLQATRRMAPDIETEIAVGEGFPDKLPDATCRELLRILQEALTNARRHSEADRITVLLEADATEVRAVVADDGRGFEPATASGGLGRSSMRERAASLGGTLEVESVPGEGTRVCFRMPRPL